MTGIRSLVLLGLWALGFAYFMNYSHESFLLRKAGSVPPPVAAISEPQRIPAPQLDAPAATGQSFTQEWKRNEVPLLQRCHATPTRALTAQPVAAIYRWTDEGGTINYSDQAPIGIEASLVTPQSPARLQYFQLDVEFVGRRQVPYLKAQVEASAHRIYQALSQLLGRERLRQVELNIRLYEKREDYQSFAMSTGSARSAQAGGFYSPALNLAVGFQYPDDQQTLAVLRHEAVHVIVTGLFGAASPLWLNEGMAEYFETMQIEGQSGIVSPNPHSLEMARQAVRSGYLRDIMTLLNMPADTWYGAAQSTHYALGSSLVYFLLDSSTGRRAMTQLLQSRADHPCGTIDQRAWLQQTWPGGAQGLQADFRRWLMASGEKKPHRY